MKLLIQKEAMPFAMRVCRGAAARGLALGVGAMLCALALLSAGIVPQVSMLPYESILHAKYFSGLLPLGWWGGTLILVMMIRRDLFKGGGKYIVMTLPFRRRQVFYAYALAGLLQFLMLWTALLVSALLLYGPVSRQCLLVAQEGIRSGLLPASMPVENILRSNGLFLAFQRSDILRLLLPPSPVEALHTLLLLLGMGVFPSYLLLGESHSINKLFAVAPFLILNRGITVRLPGVGYDLNPWQLGWSLGLLALAIGFMLFRSIRHLNRDANLI